MKSNFPKTPFTLALLFLIFSVGLFYFIYSQIERNKISAETNESLWREEVSKRGEVKTLETSLSTISQEKAELASHFSRSGDVVPLLNTLERLGASVGAEAKVTVVEGGENNNLEVAMSASGSFESLYKFITLLENSPYELEFTSLNLRKNDPKVSNSAWEAVFKLTLITFIP